MRYRKRIHAFIILVLIVLIISAVSVDAKADAGEERTIYLSATEYDYPPFSVTGSGEADGFSVELLKAVAKEMGITVTFKIDQWSVLKEELKNGELDILPLVGYTEERDEVYDFTVPYIVMRGNIFVRTGDNRIQSKEDLFGKEVLVLDGDNSQEWAWSIGLDAELTSTVTYLEAFELLADGQYDAVLAQGLVGEKLISDNGLDNISPVYVYDDGGATRQKLNLEGYEQKFCFAVVEGDKELLSILNEGLSIVSVNGTYDELYKKWFPFLLENESLSTAETIKILSYSLIPIIVLFIAAYLFATRRTIKIRTKEIMIERERSEKYLKDLILSGKIFEASIENAPIPIMIHAEDGTVLHISKSFRTLTKYDKDDVPTIYDWTEKAYGNKKAEVQDLISKLYTLKEVQHDGEHEVTTHDGRKLIWDFYSMYIGDLPDGRAVVMSTANDVTKRNEMLQQLKESEQRFKILHYASFGGIAVHDKGLILECNQGLSDITGYSINELVGMDGLLLIAPDDRAFVMDQITSGCEEVYEAYGIRKNQEVYPLQLQARNIPYNGKQVRAVEFRDITERKLAERASKENAFSFQSLFNEMSAGAAIYKVLNDGEYGKDYIIQDFNKAALKAEGKEKTEVLGRSLYDLRPNIDQYGLIPIFQSVWKTGEPAYYPSKMYADEHFSNYYENRVYKLPSGEIVAIFEDVTEKKLAEDSVRKQNDLFASLLKLLPVGVFMVDSIEGKPLVVNDMGRYLLGSGILPDANEHNLSEVYKAYKGDTQKHYPTSEMPITLGMKGISAHIDDMVVERPDGTRILLEVFGTPVFDENGNSWASLVTFMDITERKKAEEHLIYINNHDQLTGLYNRAYFEEALKRLDVKENLPLSIIMIDTNGLKIINDSFGHSVGDELLKKTASAMLQVCRPEDISVRYGGDEFIIVLPNTNDAETLKIANTIKELLSKENIANIQLSISYGYATKHLTNESILETLANAENHMYSHKLSERSSMRSKTIEIIMNTLFEKSAGDSRHSMRVSKICEAIAVALKFEKQEVDQMRVAGLVHDIGKIGIDEKILNKSGKLDIDERKEMERHPEAGWRILSSSSEFAKLAKFILHHHERWDGNGYPNKLIGENIPIESRIITVADAYDAMTSERSYKAAMSHEGAIKELLRCAGTQFDPAIVDVFVNQLVPNRYFREES